MSAYLQALLITGPRKGEVAGMRRQDLDFRWHHDGNFYGSMTMHDKVEGQRLIPCPAYLAQLPQGLPRQGEWVFGTTAPKIAHNAAYNLRKAHVAAGLPHLAMHELRRSFKSLTEWLEIPAGVVAQLMGHKPTATAERHYTVRPLDILRLHQTRIEAWILEQAGIPFTPQVESHHRAVK